MIKNSTVHLSLKITKIFWDDKMNLELNLLLSIILDSTWLVCLRAESQSKTFLSKIHLRLQSPFLRLVNTKISESLIGHFRSIYSPSKSFSLHALQIFFVVTYIIDVVEIICFHRIMMIFQQSKHFNPTRLFHRMLRNIKSKINNWAISVYKFACFYFS